MVLKQYNSFKHINQDERIEIYKSLSQWLSIRKIAYLLNRSHSSISREINRNTTNFWKWNYKYKPILAHMKAKKRRFKANLNHIKLRTNTSLRVKIYSLLSDRSKYWSPDEIIWRLKIEWYNVVSTTTLYRYIRLYSNWWWLLRFWKDWYKNKRWKRKTTTTIPNVPKISLRSKLASSRTRIWDWETDTIVSKWHSWWLCTNIERTSRYAVIWKIPNHLSSTLLTTMTYLLKWEKVKTIVSDNWTEFSSLAKLWKRLNTKVYTAHPYSSYERATNERHNWLIRTFIPKWSDISLYSDKEISIIEDKINHKPRKILDYRTPYEVYHNTRLYYIN